MKNQMLTKEVFNSPEKLFVTLVAACGVELNFHWNCFGVPNDPFVRSSMFCVI